MTSKEVTKSKVRGANGNSPAEAWATLRSPRDTAYRSPESDRIDADGGPEPTQHLAGRRDLAILDSGCGTGNNLRGGLVEQGGGEPAEPSEPENGHAPLGRWLREVDPSGRGKKSGRGEEK